MIQLESKFNISTSSLIGEYIRNVQFSGLKSGVEDVYGIARLDSSTSNYLKY